MKKLMILALIIGTASVANATLTLEADVAGTPYDLGGSGEELAVGTTVDVKVVQDVPNPEGTGGEITVTMYASGGRATDTTPGYDPYSGWEWFMNGGVDFYDNGDGTWSAWMGKTAQPYSSFGSGTPGIGSWIGVPGYGGWPYASTMEFYFITTKTTELVWGGSWDGEDYTGAVGGTVNVEPCACYGDVTGDNQVSIADLSAIVGLLVENENSIEMTPPYTICPPPDGWECADVTGDGCISIADLSAIVAHLAPTYAGTTPPYTGPCMASP